MSLMSERRGLEAQSYLSANSLAFYDDCLRFANDPLNTNTEFLPVVKIFLILQMRTYIHPELLISLTAEEFFRWGVTHQIVSVKSLENVHIGAVRFKVDMQAASCSLKRDSTPIGNITLRWLREDGMWKLDLEHVLKNMDTLFDVNRRQQGLSKTAFAKRLLREQRAYMPDRLPQP